MTHAVSPAVQTRYGFLVRKMRVSEIDQREVETLLGEILGKPIIILDIEEGNLREGQQIGNNEMLLNIKYREV